jgi:hypothetical protein
MTYTKGEDSRCHWKTMDAPERVGTCKKLRQGQLLMQRYKYAYRKGNMTRYQGLADRCKERSGILAKRMIEHAQGCNLCCKERVLEEGTFYGVFK